MKRVRAHPDPLAASYRSLEHEARRAVPCGPLFGIRVLHVEKESMMSSSDEISQAAAALASADVLLFHLGAG